MQSTQVPVVVYENGKRFIVGEATVNIEGKHLAVVADCLPVFEGWDLPSNLEVAFRENVTETTFDLSAMPEQAEAQPVRPEDLIDLNEEKPWNFNEYATLTDVPPYSATRIKEPDNA